LAFHGLSKTPEAAMKLTYNPLVNDEILRVSCQGVLSVRDLPKGSEPLLDLLGPRCYRQSVILNLERADGVDTSGLMWLVRTVVQFGPAGGKLVVYGFSPLFRNMLEVLGLTGLVNLAASEQLAIETATNLSDSSLKKPTPTLPRAFSDVPPSEAS